LAGDFLGIELQEDFLLFGNQLFGNVGRIQHGRIGGCNVHGNVLGQFLVTTLEDNQHANAVAVQVGTNHFALYRGQAADVDVLAALGNQSLTGGLAGSDQRSGVGKLLLEGFVQAVLDETLEVILQSQEVGLRVDFDDQATTTFHAHGDGAFGGDVASLLGSLDGTGGAHVVDGLLDVAVGSNQSLLALHHALASALTQFFNQGCSNFCHVHNPLEVVFNHSTRPRRAQIPKWQKGGLAPFSHNGKGASRYQPSLASEAASSTNSSVPPAALPRPRITA